MTYSPEAKALFTILGDVSVRYVPVFAREFGGVCAGMLLSQLVYWHGKQADESGWIRKTVPELLDETGLTEREQESARASLKAAGVIDYKRMGMPAKPHYRVMFDRLIATLSESKPVRTKRPIKKGRNVPACKDNRSGNVLGQNVLTNTEITSETTSESCGDAAAHPIMESSNTTIADATKPAATNPHSSTHSTSTILQTLGNPKDPIELAANWKMLRGDADDTVKAIRRKKSDEATRDAVLIYYAAICKHMPHKTPNVSAWFAKCNVFKTAFAGDATLVDLAAKLAAGKHMEPNTPDGLVWAIDEIKGKMPKKVAVVAYQPEYN